MGWCGWNLTISWAFIQRVSVLLLVPYWFQCQICALQVCPGNERLLLQWLDVLDCLVLNQSNRNETKIDRDTPFCVDELGCSSFGRAISSWSMRFCISVCWVSTPCSWGVRNQYVWLNSSNLEFFNNAFTYWMNHYVSFLGEGAVVLGWLV